MPYLGPIGRGQLIVTVEDWKRKAQKQMVTPCSALICPGPASRRGEGEKAPPRPSSGAGARERPPRRGLLRACLRGPPRALLNENSAAGAQNRGGCACVRGGGREGKQTPIPIGRLLCGLPPQGEALPAVTDLCSPSTQDPSPSKAPGSGHRHVPTRLLFACLNGEGCQVGNRRKERFPIVGRRWRRLTGSHGVFGDPLHRLRPVWKAGYEGLPKGDGPGQIKRRLYDMEWGMHTDAEITSQLLPELNAWSAQTLPRESRPKDNSILDKIE